MIQAIQAVILYELRRSRTAGRIALWLLLALTAPGLMLVGISFGSRLEHFQAALIGYVLIPQVCCMLGLLLWATPTIQAEMEAQTWIYITLRQHGRAAVLIGKYLVAVLWTGTAALVASILFSLMAQQNIMATVGILASLSLLSCFAYASLYVLIGTWFIRRSTILAVFYSLIVEYGMTFLPATVNELTVSYRLRSLLFHWTDGISPEFRQMRDQLVSQSASVHLLSLLVFTIAALSLAYLGLRYREIPMQAE